MISVNYHQPIAYHRPTPASKVNPNLPLPQVSIPKRLPVSNANSITQGRNKLSVVNEFSCSVRMWDGEYAVGLQHLKSFNYLPQECQQVQEISDACGGLHLRISRVYSDLLEETVKNLLQSLGKVNRPYLTAVEEKLLTLLESEYGKIP